jgi:hypothetical protein
MAFLENKNKLRKKCLSPLNIYWKIILIKKVTYFKI